MLLLSRREGRRSKLRLRPLFTVEAELVDAAKTGNGSSLCENNFPKSLGMEVADVLNVSAPGQHQTYVYYCKGKGMRMMLQQASFRGITSTI